MGAGQIFNFILKCHCTDDFSRQMARYFPRRLKSSVRGRLKICPAPHFIESSKEKNLILKLRTYFVPIP